VVIAEEGTLIASEAEHRQRDGYGNINADLASFDPVHECPSRRAICRENCRAIAIKIFIDDIDGLVSRVDEHARQNGSEYLFGVALHRRLQCKTIDTDQCKMQIKSAPSNCTSEYSMIL